MSASTEHWKAWGQYIAIAGVYAACYEVTRHVTFSHWVLTAGLRLSCLLLIPVRYWPALVLGEMLPMMERAVLCMPQFGWPWTLAASVPPIILCMGVMKPMRRRWSLRSADGRPRMVFLLGATLLCALLNAIKDSLTLEAALLYSPGAWPDESVYTYFWAWLLGSYLGALTLTPSILALHDRFLSESTPSLRSFLRSALLRDAMVWLVPAVVCLALCAVLTADDMTRLLARTSMLLPVLGMAWRHGWHGSAIAGMAASIALAVTSKVLLDPAMIQSQVILALVISGCLLVTARLPRTVTRPLMPMR